jgi:hypothetical protein
MQIMRRLADRNLMAEDRATYVHWIRGLLAFYGSVALLLMSVIATKTTLNRSTEIAAAPAGLVAAPRAARTSPSRSPEAERAILTQMEATQSVELIFSPITRRLP